LGDGNRFSSLYSPAAPVFVRLLETRSMVSHTCVLSVIRYAWPKWLPNRYLIILGEKQNGLISFGAALMKDGIVG